MTIRGSVVADFSSYHRPPSIGLQLESFLQEKENGNLDACGIYARNNTLDITVTPSRKKDKTRRTTRDETSSSTMTSP